MAKLAGQEVITNVPLTWNLERQLTDELGDPIANTNSILILPDGKEKNLTTDAEGKFSAEKVPFGPISIRVPALDEESDHFDDEPYLDEDNAETPSISDLLDDESGD